MIFQHSITHKKLIKQINETNSKYNHNYNKMKNETAGMLLRRKIGTV